MNTISNNHKSRKPFLGVILLALPLFSCFAQEFQDLSLDGSSFPGKIRAQFPYGLVGVHGTLSFEEGYLVWEVDGSLDKAPYTSNMTDAGLEFWSEAEVENGETIAWSGTYDGKRIFGVKSVWTRQPGDFVHDLLLPDQLTLKFKPDK